MYNIDHFTLALSSFPDKLRKPKLNSIIKSVQKPIVTQFNNFINFKEGVDYELKFNGQVIYLKHVLNDLFDNQNRSITISDTANVDNKFVYKKAENGEVQTIHLSTESTSPYFIKKKEELESSNQFIVNIPNTGIDLFALKNVVNKYKLAGKSYQINII